MGKLNFTPIKKVSQEILEGQHTEVEQVTALHQVGEIVQTEEHPVTTTVGEGRGMSVLSGPLIYNEETKGISVKIPYSLYDALDAIKKQTQRTGNPRDKMGIGDLVVQAVKEFVDRNDPRIAR